MDAKYKDIEIYDRKPNEPYVLTFRCRAVTNLKILGNMIYFDDTQFGKTKHYKFKLDVMLRKIEIS